MGAGGSSPIDGWMVLLGAIDMLQQRRRSLGRPLLEELAALRTLAFRVMSGQPGPMSAEAPAPLHHAGMARLLVNIAEAADMLGVSETTVKRLIRAGELPAVKVGGSTRIRCTDVGSYVMRLDPTVSEMEVR